jgi:septal ring factor EnvC (AmiA/AmiB activator)
MQRVNSELIACKKKTSDFFLNMKRDERINKAERDCAWF